MAILVVFPEDDSTLSHLRSHYSRWTLLGLNSIIFFLNEQMQKQNEFMYLYLYHLYIWSNLHLVLSFLIICKDFLGQCSKDRLHRVLPVSAIDHFYSPCHLVQKSIKNSIRPLTVLNDFFIPCDLMYKNH